MSGLIYAVIVVMWAAFLVPMWLRRHDEAVEAKSVDRFSTAMKVLARRMPTADPEPVKSTNETPSRNVDGLARLRNGVGRRLVSLAAGVRRHHVERGNAERATRVGRRPLSLAARRRRVLAVLSALTVVVALLAGSSVVPSLLVAPPAVLLVGYVAHLRVQARRSADLARSRARARAGGAALPELPPSRTVKITPAPSRRHDEPLAPTAGSSTTSDSRTAVVLETAGVLQTADVSRAAASAAAPDGFAGPRVAWDPVPVPSPTYVTAPRAPRAIRSIDLSTDGAWTSGRLVADAKAAAAAAVTSPSEADDEPAEARRAVGD